MLEILESRIFSSRQSNHQNCSIVQETSTLVKLMFQRLAELPFIRLYVPTRKNR